MKRFAFILLFLLPFSFAFAQQAVTPEATPPTTATEATSQASPSGIIKDVYQFSLMIGGLLAFGAIVFGAIKYTLAAGNPSGQHEGKEWITQALLGLLLLVGATLVLNTINPKLALLELPGNDILPPLENTSPPKVECTDWCTFRVVSKYSVAGGIPSCVVPRGPCSKPPSISGCKFQAVPSGKVCKNIPPAQPAGKTTQ